jgi:hypothetical protein
MSAVQPRNPRRITRPLRRARRWARHTPNGTIALNLVVLGIALLFLAAVLALTIL